MLTESLLIMKELIILPSEYQSFREQHLVTQVSHLIRLSSCPATAPYSDPPYGSVNFDTEWR